jgi:4'-phosphopantetheinyl transferase
MLPLPPNQVHLWLVFESEVQNGLLTEYRRLLTNEERQQEQRFRFANDRRRYLITRALIRTVLSRYSVHGPACWRFARNEFGRPMLVTGDGAMSSLSFNLSHTKGLILCGITRNHVVGVDVENIRCRTASLEIADQSFSSEEAAALHAVPACLQSEHFFHYWTLKESYIKARGKGLSMPLEQFSFHFPDARSVKVSFSKSLEDFPTGCRFWLLRPSSEHVAAVCVERSEGFSQDLVMRRSIPLYVEAPYECSMLRQSNIEAEM